MSDISGIETPYRRVSEPFLSGRRVTNRAISKPRPNSSPMAETAGTTPGDIAPELLARLQRGDPDALGDLFHAFGNRVYNTCRRITGCDSHAEDATQEVFLRLLGQASSFAGRAKFSTWLFRLAMNHTINLCQAARLRKLPSIESDFAAPSSTAARSVSSRRASLAVW